MESNLKLLFTEKEIQQQIHSLACRINEDYQNKDLVVIGVLNGGVYFTTDLTRHITVDHELTFVQLQSYGNETISRGKVGIVQYWDTRIDGKDVLILDDLVDTGLSMQCLLQKLEEDQPRSVRIATLIKKPETKVNPNYHCFEVDQDKWIIGYGMDWQGKQRNLRDVFELIK